jgi:hypothetical protein
VQVFPAGKFYNDLNNLRKKNFSSPATPDNWVHNPLGKQDPNYRAWWWHNVKPKLDQLVPHSEQAKIEATLAKKVPPPPSPAEVEAHDLAYQGSRIEEDQPRPLPQLAKGGPRASRLDQGSGANRSAATSRPPPARAHNPKCPRCGGRRYRWKPGGPENAPRNGRNPSYARGKGTGTGLA